MATFATIDGNAVNLETPPSTVAEARKALARALCLRHPGEVTCLLAGRPLADTDELPQEGILQIVLGRPPADSWAGIVWDASNLDEELLRSALDRDFPSPVGEAVVPESGAVAGWYHVDYWTPHNAWAKWCAKLMQLTTVRTLGQWADYWKFGESADSYGYWMVKPPFIRSKDKTIDQVVRDVKHWATLLLDLDGTFAEIEKRCEGMNLAETMEIAAAQLLRYSPSFKVHTSFKYGFEMWYRPFSQVLRWYANFANFAGPVDQAIAEEICGVFGSYSVAPDGAKQFAEQMAMRFGIEISDFDATAQWKQHRSGLCMLKEIAGQAFDSTPCCNDPHFDFICEFDAARGVDRAERMKLALHAVRAAAVAKDGLTVDMLRSWHACLHGNGSMGDVNAASRLRMADAYAKKGRERYPYHEGIENDVAACMADAESSNEWPPAVRAARVYLDICFYHPFDDGNGRLARLALDFVLSKAGLGLVDVSGLFSTSRSADDGIGAQVFVEAIQRHLAPIGAAREDALQQWFQQRDSSSIDIETRQVGEDLRANYQWFDCLTSADDVLDEE
eukprot:TRINITY_DN67974_c0_g1_i1.p1 TRINITY_DN67974_c0_g1~~TRINITY_DN67974_c0_g1_i1.p1  ORF type:complete len:561 (+),score=102.42 TRINITY_DN67974_c0_g1_i1:108-1790(+)